MKNIKNFDDCDIMEQIDETVENFETGLHYVEFTKEPNPQDQTHWRLLRQKVKVRKRNPGYVSENNEI